MGLRVYNTLTRQKEDFVPVTPGKVGMYLCGPTVYKESHIGHMIGPVIFDTVKRYLSYSGYEVTFVINITDVDDKIINESLKTNTPAEEIVQKMTADYKDNLSLMGVDSVDRFPLATEHIAEMIEIIETLVKNGHAYPLNGDVYFEVTTDDDYGKLSRRNTEEVLSGTRADVEVGKKHSADFALWKASKENEPSWPSPWGNGRPGWHIECSAMSMKYLGKTFDIHGGGLDLLFPHHENETAQSETCTGQPFAKYWMHNGLMQADDAGGKLGGDHNRHGDTTVEEDLDPMAALEEQSKKKVSKSDGARPVKELFTDFPPETLRFFLLSTHYRSPIPFNRNRIAETEKSMEGFYRLFESYERLSGRSFYDLEVPGTRDESPMLLLDDSSDEDDVLLEDWNHLKTRFLDAMDDDFNTGGAIGVLFDLRKRINGFLVERKLDKEHLSESNAAMLDLGIRLLRELTNVLGLFHHPPVKNSDANDGFANELMQLIIEIRADARKNKNFEVADKIRDRLTELKVVLEDQTGETLWHRD